MIRGALLAACLGVAAGPALADGPALIDGGNRFGQVRYYAPPAGDAVAGLIAMISDSRGWDAGSDALARHMAGEGQAVLGIDLPSYVAVLRQDKGDCSWINADFEWLTRKVEKTLPFREFHPPAIVGLGAGAGAAYAATAEVLPNTFSAGIGLGFSPVFDIGRKLCVPAAADRTTPWLFTAAADFGAPGAIRAFLAAMTQAHFVDAKGGSAEQADAALRLLPMLAPSVPLEGLPVVEVAPKDPASAARHPVAIFYSGDGGWRDIDKQIGSYLADQGFLVVGFDCLRYFWRPKQPDEMAADLDRVIRHYEARSAGHGAILVGYSFGADVLPFIVNRMAPDTRGQVKLISLLGVSEHASFEIRLDGILGAANTNGPPTLPELAKVGDIPIQCVYGFDESDTACTAKALDKIVERVEMSGGHHFNGDYHDVADAIITAAKGKVGE